MLNLYKVSRIKESILKYYDVEFISAFIVAATADEARDIAIKSAKEEHDARRPDNTNTDWKFNTDDLDVTMIDMSTPGIVTEEYDEL